LNSLIQIENQYFDFFFGSAMFMNIMKIVWVIKVILSMVYRGFSLRAINSFEAQSHKYHAEHNSFKVSTGFSFTASLIFIVVFVILCVV
jgi:hypothetical protein